jgi:hypothetical protein
MQPEVPWSLQNFFVMHQTRKHSKPGWIMWIPIWPSGSGDMKKGETSAIILYLRQRPKQESGIENSRQGVKNDNGQFITG